MGLGGCEACSLKNRTDQLVVETQHLVKEFAVFYMIALLITIELHSICDQLLLCDVLENKEVRLIFAIEIAGCCAVGLVVKETRCTTVRATH